MTPEMTNALGIYALGKAIQKIHDEDVKIEKLRKLISTMTKGNELASNLLIIFVLYDTAENNVPFCEDDDNDEEANELKRQLDTTSVTAMMGCHDVSEKDLE